MARGKIQIKKIENQTNRQVTYSKRRNGLFKKAHELTVLCDAQVSILMVSSTQKLHEYISPSITTKQLFDKYQNAVGLDLWSSHYEKMQEHLKKQKEVNRNLRREIRQRVGESLNDLGYDQIVNLIEDINNSLELIREKKYKSISGLIDTTRKKVRNVEEIHRSLLLDYDARQEDPHYGLVENEGDYNSLLGFPNGGPRIIALRGLPPNHHLNHHPNHHPNHHLNHHQGLHSGGGSDLTTFHLLE
uniref:Deficiens n=1 Tax=Mimulus ringens TaxID=188307 RepID=Q6QPY3_MIMRI|nr:deficiens [Mimulus ringens]